MAVQSVRPQNSVRCAIAEARSDRCGNAAKGFTLVEILVVIGIIATLAAILFPVFTRIKAAAKRTSCLSNIRQIGSAAALYGADFDGRLPLCADAVDKYTDIWVGSQYQATVASFGQIQGVLGPYAMDPQIFHCPADVGTHVADLGFPHTFETTPSMFGKYGCSYLWRTELSVQSKSVEDLPDPAAVNLIFDASGSWHTIAKLMTFDDVLTGLEDQFHYNVGFADSHAKYVSYDGLEAAWRSPIQ